MLKALTIKWNRDRGLLNNFDPKLELKMMSEEAAEFYAAETPAHMLAEYADFQFVLDGSKAKFGSQVIESHLDLDLRVKIYNDMMTWASKVQSDMRSCLASVFQPNPSEVNRLIDMARGLVIKCNFMKGEKKNAEGKIVKNEEHINPTDLIQAELDRLGF